MITTAALIAGLESPRHAGAWGRIVPKVAAWYIPLYCENATTGTPPTVAQYQAEFAQMQGYGIDIIVIDVFSWNINYSPINYQLAATNMFTAAANLGTGLKLCFAIDWPGVRGASSISTNGNFTIVSLGNTNWLSVGAGSSPFVGQNFTATANGSGTGTVVDAATNAGLMLSATSPAGGSYAMHPNYFQWQGKPFVCGYDTPNTNTLAQAFWPAAIASIVAAGITPFFCPVFKVNGFQAGTFTTAGAFQVGNTYTINLLGNTTTAQWNAAGAAGTPYPGQLFVATGVGTGTGTAINTSTTNSGMLTNFNNGWINGVSTAAGSFVTGYNYTITALGNTPWSACGAGLFPYIGQNFVATGPGTGTGTANAQLVQGLINWSDLVPTLNMSRMNGFNYIAKQVGIQAFPSVTSWFATVRFLKLQGGCTNLEFQGFQGVGQMWQQAIAQGAPIVFIMTWNDVTETVASPMTVSQFGTANTPSTWQITPPFFQTQVAHAEMHRYWINQLKGGSQALPTKDTMFVSYRLGAQSLTNSPNFTGTITWAGDGGVFPALDYWFVTIYATGAGTVTVNTGGTITNTAVNAGLTNLTGVFAAGATQTFTFTRNNMVQINITGVPILSSLAATDQVNVTPYTAWAAAV